MKRFLNFKKEKKLKTGFTLVETLVAVSIFSMAVLALMSILGSGISNINYVKTKVAASYLAQEGIEYARNVRDNYVLYDPGGAQAGWNNFTAAGISYPSPDPKFVRTILMAPVSSNETRITSKVEWTQKSGSYSIILTENLFNWVE